MDEEIGCMECGYDGIAPDDWWHKPLAHLNERGVQTQPDGRTCDLCWSTIQMKGDIGEAISVMNYGFNRSLEVLREMRSGR
jgi:hypothetical protein